MFGVFLDNFRGFKNTLVTLNDVNFLVGENSTGKTSFLSLVYLLSDARFWFTTKDFYDEDIGIDLGSYEDIITYVNRPMILGLSRKKFSRDKDRVDCLLMILKKKDNRASLYQLYYFKNNREVRVFNEKGNLFYKSKIYNDLRGKSPINFLKKWTENNHSEIKGFKKTKSFTPFPLDSIFGLINAADLTIGRKQKTSRKFTVSFPVIQEKITWISPVRSKPKRIYDLMRRRYSPEGDHMPYLLLKLEGESKKFYKRIEEKIIKFGDDSGLWKKVKTRSFLKDNKEPFELRVTIEKKSLLIPYVGYGVSQLLPIVTDILSSIKGEYFSIQQPEIHIHPRAQAAFGGLIFDQATINQNNFLIETHSDYVIDRFRIRMRDSRKKRVSSQVLFFEKENTLNKIHQIAIEKDGSYSKTQPENFRDFFIKEKLNGLGLK